MSVLPKIIDNQRHKLIDVLNTIAPQYEYLSIATGYWDLLGMQMILDKLHHYKKIRLLIGREPLIPRHKILQPEPDYPDKDFFYDLEQLQPTQELKHLVQQIKYLIGENILEVKVYRQTFLHAKCYVFGNYDSDKAIGIIGSSNFTKNGLTHNTELNALETDHRIVTFSPKTEKQEVGHLYWFDQLWNDDQTEDWNGSFTQLLEQSPVGDVLFSPYETYIRTLYELYKEELEEENLDKSIKGKHELLSFQTKNVNALLRRLRKYKVAMLADSVGLGKTYTAIEVIKQYKTDGTGRIEIICPKSLKNQWTQELSTQYSTKKNQWTQELSTQYSTKKNQWTQELSTQYLTNIEPVTLQNPEDIKSKKLLDHIASVSLFVIDESHNLKNRNGKRFEQVGDWIRDNPKAHVLLLTATPINNQLSDITSQILLGSRGEAKIFKVTVVDKNKQTVRLDFHQAIENLKKKINQEATRKGRINYEYIRQTMAPILRAFVVRRTRQGIQKEYGHLSIGGKKQAFPKVIPEVKKYGYERGLVEKLRNIKVNNINLDHIYLLLTKSIIDKTKDLKHPLDQIKTIDDPIDKKVFDDISPVYFVHQIILLLGFVPYRWRMYQTQFYGKTRDQIMALKISAKEKKDLFLQISIYGILRTMFLKRLESSVSAVLSSVETYKRKLDVFEKGIDSGEIVSLKDLSNIEERLGLGDEDIDVDDIVLEEEDVLDSLDSKKYNVEAIREDIKKERILLDVLTQQLTFLKEDDSKIKAFIDLLEDIHKKQPEGTKVLVFSYYADTVNYLEQKLPKYTKLINDKSAGFLSSKNRKSADELSGQFAPLAKKYTLPDGKQELDYLISTDILSEGQNLQDCGILINYDLHWNPVRMIQRNGRVNRIGTRHPNVHIYNIMPDSQLEEYLRLVNRLEGKIKLIQNTIGTDTPVLDEEENPIEFMDSWKDIYSDDMKTRMEAMEQSEQETDIFLSEDVYVSDLKIFHNDPKIDDTYRQQIYNIALGKWAMMCPSDYKGGRPELLILNRLYEDDYCISGHSFTAMNRERKDFHTITRLQALEWLKVDKSANKRREDNVSCDKVLIGETNKKNVLSYVDEDERGSPIGQQVDILRIMHENHYSEDDIESVRSSFQTTNVLDKEKITKLVRSIMKDKKNNSMDWDKMKKLIDLAKKTRSADDEDKKKLHSVRQVLFYVRDNK